MPPQHTVHPWWQDQESCQQALDRIRRMYRYHCLLHLSRTPHQGRCWWSCSPQVDRPSQPKFHSMKSVVLDQFLRHPQQFQSTLVVLHWTLKKRLSQDSTRDWLNRRHPQDQPIGNHQGISLRAHGLQLRYPVVACIQVSTRLWSRWKW